MDWLKVFPGWMDPVLEALFKGFCVSKLNQNSTFSSIAVIKLINQSVRLQG